MTNDERKLPMADVLSLDERKDIFVKVAMSFFMDLNDWLQCQDRTRDSYKVIKDLLGDLMSDNEYHETMKQGLLNVKKYLERTFDDEDRETQCKKENTTSS